MQDKYRILLVEDEQNFVEAFKDTLSGLSYEDEVELVVVDSAEKAEEYIQSSKGIDAAIIDLHLAESSLGQEKQGNIVIKRVREIFRCPIVVSSNFIGDLAYELQLEQSIFFCPIAKQETQAALNHIYSICSTGLTRIINRKGKIDEMLQNVFQSHLPNSMNYWINKNKESSSNVESALLRYILTHLQEHLEMTEAKLDTYHHTEMYIKPIIKQLENTVFTGDILKYIEREEYYYVITPLCDLVSKSVSDITLIKIEEESSLPNTSGSLGLIKKNNQAKYHYLHSVDNVFSGGALNFQKVIHVPISDIKGESPKFSIECSVTQAFKKDITARFANYYARQGQPGFI